jgi:hypothetical protein
MLSWEFVKADPITYRATDGAIRFEVTVGADNRNAITVTRTEGESVFLNDENRKWLI